MCKEKCGKFIVSELYYKAWHHVNDVDDACRPVIETWVFLGVVERPGKSDKAEGANREFYQFSKWASALEKQSVVLNIPTLEQAGRSMLTWDELLIAVGELNSEMIVSRNIDAIAAECRSLPTEERIACLDRRLAELTAHGFDESAIESVRWAVSELLKAEGT